MDRFIDFTDRKRLNEILVVLTADTRALWGYMDAQQMVEHLIESVEHTNGKKTADLTETAAAANRKKQFLIYSDNEIPKGIMTPLKADLPGYRFENLETAINTLNKEIDAFEAYFKAEGSTAIHPGLGELNYKEWAIFHSKHFTHHFNQFNLL